MPHRLGHHGVRREEPPNQVRTERRARTTELQRSTKDAGRTKSSFGDSHAEPSDDKVSLTDALAFPVDEKRLYSRSAEGSPSRRKRKIKGDPGAKGGTPFSCAAFLYFLGLVWSSEPLKACEERDWAFVTDTSLLALARKICSMDYWAGKCVLL